MRSMVTLKQLQSLMAVIEDLNLPENLLQDLNDCLAMINHQFDIA
jgi:hypothetical protein